MITQLDLDRLETLIVSLPHMDTSAKYALETELLRADVVDSHSRRSNVFQDTPRHIYW